MEALTWAMRGVANPTPLGCSVCSLLGGSTLAAFALLSFLHTNYQKDRIKQAKAVPIVIENGRLTLINGVKPTSCQEYKAQLEQIARSYSTIRVSLEFLIFDLNYDLLRSLGDKNLEAHLSTIQDRKKTELGRLMNRLEKIKTSDFAKQIEAAEQPNASLLTKLTPYRHEIGCLLAALPFYGAFGYFLAVQRAALRAAAIPGITT